MNQTKHWDPKSDRVLIWDFRGQESFATAKHFASHLRQELPPEVCRGICVQQESPMHNFCAAWVSVSSAPDLVKNLKPQRGCLVSEFEEVYPELFASIT